MGKVIVATMILHNWLIDLKEPEDEYLNIAPIVIDVQNVEDTIADTQAINLRNSLNDYLVFNNNL